MLIEGGDEENVKFLPFWTVFITLCALGYMSEFPFPVTIPTFLLIWIEYSRSTAFMVAITLWWLPRSCRNI